MALFIRTQAHARRTYFPRRVYLSRLAYLCHSCERLLNVKVPWLLEPFAGHEPTTSTSTFSVAKPTDDAILHKRSAPCDDDDVVSDDAASSEHADESAESVPDEDANSSSDSEDTKK